MAAPHTSASVSMNRRLGAIAGCAVGLLAAFAATAQQQPVFPSPLASFDFTYRAQPEPGNRHWTSPDGINWTETYPSGRQTLEKVVGAAQINGCAGVVTTYSNVPPSQIATSAQTFVPNPGCAQMQILFRPGSAAPWHAIGQITSTTVRPGAAAPPPTHMQ